MIEKKTNFQTIFELAGQGQHTKLAKLCGLIHAATPRKKKSALKANIVNAIKGKDLSYVLKSWSLHTFDPKSRAFIATNSVTSPWSWMAELCRRNGTYKEFVKSSAEAIVTSLNSAPDRAPVKQSEQTFLVQQMIGDQTLHTYTVDALDHEAALAQVIKSTSFTAPAPEVENKTFTLYVAQNIRVYGSVSIDAPTLNAAMETMRESYPHDQFIQQKQEDADTLRPTGVFVFSAVYDGVEEAIDEHLPDYSGQLCTPPTYADPVSSDEEPLHALCRAFMALRPELKPMSLNEWLFENVDALTDEEVAAGRAITELF